MKTQRMNNYMRLWRSSWWSTMPR